MDQPRGRYRPSRETEVIAPAFQKDCTCSSTEHVEIVIVQRVLPHFLNYLFLKRRHCEACVYVWTNLYQTKTFFYIADKKKKIIERSVSLWPFMVQKLADTAPICMFFFYPRSSLQSCDVWLVDHLATVSQGALGNPERHFLNVAEEWLCHDWRNRCYRKIYVFLSLRLSAQWALQRPSTNLAFY